MLYGLFSVLINLNKSSEHSGSSARFIIDAVLVEEQA